MKHEIQNIESDSQQAIPLHGFILIVDDDMVSGTVLREALEGQGHEVEEAGHGLEALRKMAMRMADVILPDSKMPQMNGFEVCRRIRQNALTAYIPILMITSLFQRGDRLLGIHAGANDFLNKPIDLRDVILRVENAIYAKHLYDQLPPEKVKAERLLLNILPEPFAELMNRGEIDIAQRHSNTTVLVAGLVGFTSTTANQDCKEKVRLLNGLFGEFDTIVEDAKLEKIKTIGVAYMTAGNLFQLRTDHAEAIAELAINMQEKVERINHEHNTAFRLRIGICTGPVISGVVGRKKFAFDIWGETVDLACRLESTAKAGKIQVSEATRERLNDKYHLEQKGKRWILLNNISQEL